MKIVRKLAAMALAAAVLLPLWALRAEAALTPEQKAFAEGYSDVVVCGSSSSAPVELLVDGEYVGVMPEFFHQLSLTTGLRFRYLDYGAGDQYTQGENQQCEILSAVTLDDQALLEKGLIPGPVCFQYEGTSYRIAYTQRAPEELISLVNTAIGDAAGPVRTQSAVDAAGKLYTMHIPLWARVLMIGAVTLCILLLALAVFLTVRFWRKIRRVSGTDSLTGLRNLEGFARDYENLKKNLQAPLYTLAYILIDCEKLRLYLGGEEADQRLQIAAATLRQHQRENWYTARADASGLLLCFCLEGEEAESVLEPILTEIRDNVNDNQGSMRCGVWAGMHPCEGGNTDLNQLLDTVRLTACCAQEQEQLLLRSSRELTQRARQNYRTAQDILASIDLSAFEVYALPQVSMDSGNIVSAQALVRWRHPEKGLLMPGSFLFALEGTEKMVELDCHIFKEACAWTLRRREQGLAALPISCNLSLTSLRSARLSDRLSEYLERYQVPRGGVAVEIDAGILGASEAVVEENIAQLHEAGVPVILDNFGSDQTSLRCLAANTVDQVKLFRGLLPAEGMARNDMVRTLLLLKNTIALCKKLGLSVTASGVETAAQHTVAMEMGCNAAEGFHYYRPVPQGEFDNLSK